ncbi:MAG: prephenate dehydratase [Solirubrobacterales bacterium]
MKVAYLGPAGTFSEEALRLAAAGAEFEPLPTATIHGAVEAVEDGTAERALVPFENSIEGTVRPTLDALAFDTDRVRIVGEYDHRVHQMLIAAAPLEPAAVERVLSHPQGAAQCAGFLRAELGGATVETVSSTSEAVRRVTAEPGRPWAALGSAAAADAYGGVVLREDVEDARDNVTRFVWLADSDAEAPAEVADRPWRTTLVFDELGDDHPGALVDALSVLSDRGINMTRIESRPRRSGLGSYLFFIDLDGRADTGDVGAGIDALRERAETVRVLGSYQVGAPPPLPRRSG